MKRRWLLTALLPLALTGLVLARRMPSRDPRLPFDPPVPSAPGDIFAPDTPANRALYAALNKNDVAGVKRAFAQGASANAKYGQSYENQQEILGPFLAFVQPRENNDLDKPQAILIFREFLAYNVDIKAKDNQDMSAIHWACRLGDVNLVKEVLARGADINAPSKIYGTPLIVTISPILRDKEGPELPLITLLLEKGANPNTFMPMTGMTPLMQAALSNHPKTARLLLKYGADPALTSQNPQMMRGQTRTALELAGSEEMTRILSAAHPNMTAFEAAVSGNLARLKTLLDSGTDPKSTNSSGTPLIVLAAQSGNATLVKLLLERGADPNATTRPSEIAPQVPGPTALHAASTWGYVEVMRVLLDHRADIDARTGYPDLPVTPLTNAVQGTEPAAVKLLLERGATPGDALERLIQSAGRMPTRRKKRPSLQDALDRQNKIYDLLVARVRTPEPLGRALCVALDGGQFGLAEDLLRRDASLEAKDRDGKTPLMTLIEYIWLKQDDLTPGELQELTVQERKERQQEVDAEMTEALHTLDVLLARKPDIREALSFARREKLPSVVVARLEKIK